MDKCEGFHCNACLTCYVTRNAAKINVANISNDSFEQLDEKLDIYKDCRSCSINNCNACIFRNNCDEKHLYDSQ